tara:strand:+ start:168 stop:515 length:348 start_codon:yes stop_codon:yes gene_type:complete
MFSIEIAANGQPTIRTTPIASLGRVMYRNNGFDLVEQVGANACTKAEIVAAFVAAHPGVSYRNIKAGIRITKPADMVATVDHLESFWQDMASRNVSHADMRIAMINHPVIAALRA